MDDKPMKQTHFALLRFKTKDIEEETGITCEEVEIKKAIYFEGQIYNESNIKFDNLYSQKVTGKIQRRSICNLGTGKRYIPPVDFFDQLEKKCQKLSINIECNSDIDLKVLTRAIIDNPSSTYISTLPIINLYKFVHQEEIKFDFEKVFVVELNIENCNVHQTIYYPSRVEEINQPAYRISLIGNNIKCEISAETMKEFWKDGFEFEKLLRNLDSQIWNSFGIEIDEEVVEQLIQTCLYDGVDKVIHEQKFGKISPINEQLRHSIIYNLTKQYGIYSLGRFSCWRQIMLDDVVKDVKKIENLIKLENMSGYEAAKNMASKL
jgi:hypothetical protein